MIRVGFDWVYGFTPFNLVPFSLEGGSSGPGNEVVYLISSVRFIAARNVMFYFGFRM